MKPVAIIKNLSKTGPLTLRSNDGLHRLDLKAGEDHAFTSQEELAHYRQAVDAWKAQGSLNVSFESAEAKAAPAPAPVVAPTAPAPVEAPVDEAPTPNGTGPKGKKGRNA